MDILPITIHHFYQYFPFLTSVTLKWFVSLSRWRSSCRSTFMRSTTSSSPSTTSAVSPAARPAARGARGWSLWVSALGTRPSRLERVFRVSWCYVSWGPRPSKLNAGAFLCSSGLLLDAFAQRREDAVGGAPAACGSHLASWIPVSGHQEGTALFPSTKTPTNAQ